MAKTKILVLVKANPSPFAKEVLQYQEKLIRENMEKLDKVAEALLEKEVISAEEFQELIK